MAKLQKIFEKRRRISKKDALEVLNDNFQELFVAYNDGLEHYNIVIQELRPEVRVRIDSGILNACIAQSFMEHFPDKWTLGKYGRIIFRWEGISMLIKKLNKNSKPSYIPTMLSDAITTQQQVSLFNCDEAKEDAILLFGYTKNSHGELLNPRIVYYDSEVKWIADLDDVVTKPVTEPTAEPMVRLRQENINKKAE
ncbi:hypothetical protein [Segatella copri]|uniref:Uncharacterized protein n=1 Tax=Segatella copri TaxID=165179 RepID=A0AAW4N0K6_9BACT|nr:hypothetical protein [Segatella copri]MBV3388356.1 hypothetical protein [Segatella copri]MBV3396164.1 hypothetical protein [Segatella copri]MBV3405816.1 hypothetical protein [Segatella copri]